MQQRCIKVADFAVPVLHVVREVEVATPSEPGVLAGNEDEGPLPAATVVGFGGVGKINDDRVVQHRAVPFGHAFQFLHQVGHELEVKLVNLDLELTGAHVLEAPSVSDAVFANVNAKPGELHAEVGVTHPGGDGDGVSQSANHGGRRQVELGVEPIGLDLRLELVGDFGGNPSQSAFDFAQAALAVAHVLVTFEVGLQFVPFGPGDLSMETLDALRRKSSRLVLALNSALEFPPATLPKSAP